MHHPFYSIPWVTQTSPDSVWKETTPFCQEVKIIGDHFGGRYSKHLVHRLFAKIYVYPLRIELRPTAKKTLRWSIICCVYVYLTFRKELGCVCACSVAQSCPTLPDPMDCSPSGSSVHGIFQARILEGATISFSRGSS